MSLLPLTKIPATGLDDNLAQQIQQGGGPKISSITYVGDDTAALPAGGQTITISGSGFTNSSAVYIDGAQVGVVSFVDANTLTFVAPAKAASSYSLYVVNGDGATAISVPGISYSNAPVWSTSSGSIGSPFETDSFNVSLSATGDGSITYAMAAGNSLPSGLTLASNGYISGTIPATDPTTTYTFYVVATDSQNQDTERSFSITFNKDAVTWTSPANGAAYSLTTGVANSFSLEANSAAGKSITYTVQSGTLPVNVSISGANIVGTPTLAQENTSVVIRATAADTLRYADRTLYYSVQAEPDPYFSNVMLLVRGNGANGSTTFTDESSRTTTVTRLVSGSGEAYVTTDTPKYGSGSLRFSGNNTGNRGGFKVPYHASFNFRSDATLEFWIRVREYSTNPNFGGSVHPVANFYGSALAWTLWVFGGTMKMDIQSNELPPGYSGTYSEQLNSPNALPENTWKHFAVVRSANTFTMYENGTSVATKTIAGSGLTIMNVYNQPSAELAFGYLPWYTNASSNIDLDDIRFSDFARYATNFTAPTKEAPAN